MSAIKLWRPIGESLVHALQADATNLTLCRRPVVSTATNRATDRWNGIVIEVSCVNCASAIRLGAVPCPALPATPAYEPFNPTWRQRIRNGVHSALTFALMAVGAVVITLGFVLDPLDGGDNGPPAPADDFDSYDRDRDCSDFRSSAEAQDYFESGAGSNDNLDADHDGRACEALP
jgi:hypothetical protein